MKHLPLLLALALSGAAQSPASTPTPSQSSDPELVLQSSMHADGSVGVTDLSAVGTMIRYVAGQELSAPVTFKATQTGNVRFEADFDGLPKGFIFAAGFSQTIDRDGKPTFHAGTVTLFHLITLPGWTLASLAQDSRAKTLRSASTDELEIDSAPNDPSSARENESASLKVFIGSKSMLVDRIASTVTGNQPDAIALPYELTFDDYRAVNGATIPFTITERVNGQKTWTIKLESVTTNTGLTDADFAQ